MKLDNINNFDNIDLSMCKTAEDKIKKILEIDKYYFDQLFDLLCEQDQKLYFQYLPTYHMRTYLKNQTDKFIFGFIINNYINIDKFIINDFVNLITDENLKYKIIIFLMNKMEFYFIIPIIENIHSEKLKIQIIKKMIEKDIDHWHLVSVIKLLNDDENKELFINFLDKRNRIDVIKSFKNKNLIKEYAQKKEYIKYRSALVAATNDNEFIKNQFLEINSLKFRYNLISLIEDEKFKLELISLLDDNDIKYFLLSNFDKYQKYYLQNIDEYDIVNSNIDENITIGVELECCNKNYEKFKSIENILKTFKIVPDISVNKGFEIVSPILHFRINDLQQLKSVCKILEKCNFYTDYSCGGHIHIGASYLESIEDIYMLLYFYTNCEQIIYKICNKEHSKPRRRITRYAKTTKKIYLKASENESLNDKLTLNNLIVYLKKINKSRYKGLNVDNLDKQYKNTIEFRMPNGEIEFKELLYNIKLFAKLVQKSHELTLANNTQKEQVKLLSSRMLEKDRLEIFLNILFDSEKEKDVYRKRYYSNRNIIGIIKNDLFYKNEELIEIDENNKKLTKKKNQV